MKKKIWARCLGTVLLLGAGAFSYAGCAPTTDRDEAVANGPGDGAGTEEPYDFEQENVGETAEALWTPSALPPALIPKGIDCFYTSNGTVFDFSQYAIPAGWFMPGSAPYSSKLRFGHRGVTGDDTCMKRYFDLDFTNAALPATLVTPIRLRTLTMQSVSPAAIMVNGSATYWRVWVDLSPSTMTANGGSTPASPTAGTMEVTKTSPDGGTFQSTFYVKPQFTFFKCTDKTCATLAAPAVTKVFDFVQQFPTPMFPNNHEISMGPVVVDWMTDEATIAAFDDPAKPESKIMNSLCDKITPAFRPYCGQNFVPSVKPPPPGERCCPLSCHKNPLDPTHQHCVQLACCPHPQCPNP